MVRNLAYGFQSMDYCSSMIGFFVSFTLILQMVFACEVLQLGQQRELAYYSVHMSISKVINKKGITTV